MKKLLMLLAMVIGVAILSASAQSTTQCIMLKNGAKAEFFDKNSIQAAYEAAVDGDTLLFTEGAFVIPKDFTVSKKITFMGAGKNTILSGHIYVKFIGEEILSSTFLENLNLTGILRIYSSLTGLKLKKAKIDEALFVQKEQHIQDVEIDRCYIECLDGSQSKNLGTKIVNSYIAYACDECKNVVFDYCLLYRVNASLSLSDYGSGPSASCSCVERFESEVNNSIICGLVAEFYEILKGGSISNSMINNSIDIKNVQVDNLYIVDNGTIDNLQLSNPECVSKLIADGYLSSDGKTPVGPFGGPTPLDVNYAPAGPVLASQPIIDVDKDKRQIKVTVELETK